MDLDKLADEARRENIVSIVAQMARVDGILHDNELVYILKLGLSLGLSGDQVRSIVQEKSEVVFVPHEEVDRLTILYYLVILMMVDGHIAAEEEELLHHFGLRLGFNPLMIEGMIDVIGLSGDQALGKDAMLNEMKKYLN